MRRRALVRTAGLLGLLALIAVSVVGWLLHREPASYRNIAVPEGPERRKLSGEFSSNVLHLIDNVGSTQDNPWQQEFTSEQMNSYFEEDFVRVKPFKLPHAVNSPRVVIKPGRLQLAFRYGEGYCSSVVTVDLNVWLVANEPNMIAVEVAGVHAGALPVATHSVLEQIADNARQHNIEVNWYRHDDKPVALVRLQPDRPNPTMLLQRLELQEGRIVIAGKATDSAPIKSFLSMAEVTRP